MSGKTYKFRRLRMAVLGLLVAVSVAGLLATLYDIQVTNHKSYQEKVAAQRRGNVLIAPKRGIVYDRNMTVLAHNTQVEEVFISPADIKDPKEAELIARGLSELLGVDYGEIYEKTQKKDRKDENIKHGVEISVANEVRKFKSDHGIKAIYLRDQTKRVYPYANRAAQVIGFTGTENRGLYGVEARYDEYLSGVPGRIITTKNAIGKSVNTEYSTYVDVQNGNNIVLTIDWTIQEILEKNLEEAFRESRPRERVTGIVMDVNSGEILAMATKPDFDPNAPYEIDPDVFGYINLSANALLDLENRVFETEEDRQNAINKQKLYKLWNNKAVTEPYEPGSTFKVMTSALAIEEKVVMPSDGFYCSGSHTVGGIDIPCHLAGGHGRVTFAGGLQQSCNPVLMQTAEKLGNAEFLKYFNAFGYNQRTGIDLPSEAAPILHAPANFRSVELATASFGQRFKITPIQQIVGIAAVANGGRLVTPRIVKAITDSNGNVVKSFDAEIKRMVISQETSKTLARILAEGVSNNGAARNAYVKGYDVAAKTGTSQKEVNTDGRIGSCVAWAPVDKAQVAVLIIVDEPSVGSVYGGVIAAPYIAKTLAEVLPYLGIEPAYADLIESYINIDNFERQKLDEAKEKITSKGLRFKIVGEGDTVREQMPKKGNNLPKGGLVVLYTESVQEKETVPVPDVIGLGVRQASERMGGAGLNINIRGAEGSDSGAVARSQKPAPGEPVPIGTIVEVEFRHHALTD